MAQDSRAVAQVQAPWARPCGVQALLQDWRARPELWNQIALEHALPANPERASPLPEELHPSLRDALAQVGLHHLYRHQRLCWDAVQAGQDVVVATPTASGKSLAYNLPVLQALAEDSATRALYLFPTKALARDQEEALHELLRRAGLPAGCVTYDGDTPADARRASRERSGVLITNPDMLHTGILPHHPRWGRLFANLRYVVIDEVHIYRGVFGSHLANVLRRLLRVAAFHGASPQFVCSSATIANPKDHASRLIGRTAVAVTQSGAPTGPRQLLVYNPPVVNAELGLRRSYLKESVRLCAELLRYGVTTLLFAQSRNNVETALKYLRDAMRAEPGWERAGERAILAYRGGYLPSERRDIESSLRAGDVRCVVATRALELGIDVGALDAVVCAGFPGTMAATWQRFGRAGRRQRSSLAVLVTSSAPLDQFVAQEPERMLETGVEEARIDPDHLHIVLQHLRCAAFELPFRIGEREGGFGTLSAADTQEAMGYLAEQGYVHEAQPAAGVRAFHWIHSAYPANEISLRSAAQDNFVIIDVDRDRTLAEMDFRSVHTMLHEQAIYQHDGHQYQVERLDYPNHKGYVRRVEPDYFTDAMTYTHLRITAVDQEEPFGAADASLLAAFAVGLGEVHLEEKVVGYKKIRFHTHDNVGFGDVDLPPLQMDTEALWLTVEEPTVQSLPYARSVVVDATRGLGRVLHTVGAVALMTDPRDLGVSVGCRARDDDKAAVAAPMQQAESGGAELFAPTVFIYDRVAGGLGLARRLHASRWEVLRRALALLERCDCPSGCPACIGPRGESQASRQLKVASLDLAKRLSALTFPE